VSFDTPPAVDSLPVETCHPEALMDAVLKSENITVERKNFIFDLRENPRGRFLRITEDAHGRRDSIVIPAPGLEEFRRVLDEIIEAHRHAGASAS
jgi:hypothetical protein